LNIDESRPRGNAHFGYVIHLVGCAQTSYRALTSAPTCTFGCDNPPTGNHLNASNREVTVINSLNVEQFHSICYWNLLRRRTITVSTNSTVQSLSYSGSYSLSYSSPTRHFTAKMAKLRQKGTQVGGQKGTALKPHPAEIPSRKQVGLSCSKKNIKTR
jgi:hypothetical protein